MSDITNNVDTVAIIATTSPYGNNKEWHLAVPISQEAILEEELGIFPSEHGPLLLCLTDWVSSEKLRKTGVRTIRLNDGRIIKSIKRWVKEHLGADILEALPK